MNLLIVRLSALGDVIHTLPALELLRQSLPEATLTWVVEAPAAPLLEGHPALDRVVVYDRRAMLETPTRARALRQALRAWKELRGQRFDAAIDFQGLLRSAAVARFSGARQVFGPRWAREGATLFYKRKLDVPRPEQAHAVARAGAIVRASLEALGLPAPPADAPLPSARFPTWSDPAQADPPLVLLPGAGKPANRPPPDLLAEVADDCARRFPELPVLLVGGPGDRRRGEAVVERCQRARARSLCGELDVVGSAQVLAGARLVVGGDTGPLHLARALGAPVLGLFHAAEAFRTGPGGLPGSTPWQVLQGTAACAPCRAHRCQRADGVRVCLDGMTERAARAAREFLARSGSDDSTR